MAESWLEKVGDVQDILDRLGATYDLDAVCSEDNQDTIKAVMALALNQALNETNLSHRKKKRIVTQIAKWVTTGAVAVFVLGVEKGIEGA